MDHQELLPWGGVSRREFGRLLAAVAAVGTGRTACAAADTTSGAAPAIPGGTASDLTPEMLAAAEKIAGLSFTDDQRRMMLGAVKKHLADFDALRGEKIENGLPPAVVFMPERIAAAHGGATAGKSAVGVNEPAGSGAELAEWSPPETPQGADLAFLPVWKLANLIRARKVSSVELTRLYLDRLRRFDPELHCVVTLLEESAVHQAEEADREIAAGRWRGPLHGIPWGAKDLLAVPGAPTTWGAAPYQNQVLPEESAVAARLREAGAVLVAKLSMGELALGDVWFGGRTNNPWNPKQGSSGSSAGPAAAVAAGLVGFAIGSETLGSIVSPSTVCRVTGLRPTFGRVSRFGAMALAFSMDKLGPMARSAEDCGLIFAAIHGRDPRDPATGEAEFVWRGGGVKGMRVGFSPTAAGDDAARIEEFIRTLEAAGAEIAEVAWPGDLRADALRVILDVEAAAAFDDLTRSGGLDQLKSQHAFAWPNLMRVARLVPAVEYLQAQRIRSKYVGAVENLFAEIDVYVGPSFAGNQLALTNQTGHPALCVPMERDSNSGRSLTILGGLNRDDRVLAAGAAYQSATHWHEERPDPYGE